MFGDVWRISVCVGGSHGLNRIMLHDQGDRLQVCLRAAARSEARPGGGYSRKTDLGCRTLRAACSYGLPTEGVHALLSRGCVCAAVDSEGFLLLCVFKDKAREAGSPAGHNSGTTHPRSHHLLLRASTPIPSSTAVVWVWTPPRRSARSICRSGLPRCYATGSS